MPQGWNLLLLLNICAMVFSGTRNNIIVAIVAPLLVVAWYRKGRPRQIISMFLAITVAIGLSVGVLQAMISPDEFSNSVKLGHFHDYGTLFTIGRLYCSAKAWGQASSPPSGGRR